MKRSKMENAFFLQINKVNLYWIAKETLLYEFHELLEPEIINMILHGENTVVSLVQSKNWNLWMNCHKPV